MTSVSASAESTTAPIRMIFWLAAAAFASSASVRVADPLLPSIAGEFGESIGGASHIVTAYAIAYGLFQLVYGPLGDRMGKTFVVTIITLGASLATFACIFATSLGALTGLRFLAGVFAGGLIPLSLAYIGDTVPLAARQTMLARFVVANTLGLVLGQAAGGFLAEYLSWRAVFGGLAIFFLIAAVGLRRELGPLRDLRPVGTPPPLLESYQKAFGLFRLPMVRAVLSSIFLEGVLLFGALTFVGSHLHARFGLGLDRVGLVLALFGIGGVFYSLAAPLFIRTMGERGLASAGGVLLGVGFLGAAVSGPSPFLVIAPAMGLGWMMLHNTLQTKATQMAPEARGSAMALFSSSFYIGQTTGVALAGLSFDAWGAVPGFVTAAIGLPLLGVLFAVFLGKIAKT
ncbi:MFS transporter [Flaviflagellibacter deserti]